jgi:hypothetical protein
MKIMPFMQGGAGRMRSAGCPPAATKILTFGQKVLICSLLRFCNFYLFAIICFYDIYKTWKTSINIICVLLLVDFENSIAL